MLPLGQFGAHYGRVDGAAMIARIEHPAFLGLPHQEFYALLWAYYLTNGLYDTLRLELQRRGEQTESIKELRDPAHRATEFHVAKLYPGDLPDALPIKTANKHIQKPISQVWGWSNFSAKKQLLARWFSCLGDAFVKITTHRSSDGQIKVLQQAIDPRHVTEFQVDMQGHIQFIRIDVPQLVRTWKRHIWNPREGQWTIENKFWTEVWDRQMVKIWAASDGPSRPTESLGTPDPAQHPDNLVRQHGLPFVPFVWAPFKDIGASRGLGVFAHCLGKIDECNRVATRLHELIFRHDDVTWALESNHTDPTGRPLPPPRLTGEGVRETSRGKVIELGGSKVVELPGNSKLAPIIPSLDYNALVQVLKEQQEELRNDLPELRYYDITTRSHVSGTAMRLALADAIDRVTEARGMMFGALVRANAMALTVGQRWNLPGFASNQIGTYEQGDFEHSFVRPTVIDLSPQEEAQAWGTYTQAGLPPRTTGRRLGWPEEDQDQLDQDRLAEVEFQIALKQKQQDAELDAAKRAEQAKAEVQEEQQARLLERQKQIAQEERDDQERRGDQQAEKQVERSVRQQRALKELDLEFEAKKQKILGQDQGQDQGQGQGVSGNGKGPA